MASASENVTREKKVFSTDTEVAKAMAEYTFERYKEFCARGYFTVVLSGGDLVGWLKELLDAKYDTIDWSKWHVFWVDERVVPLDHKDSNYKQTYDSFLSKVQIPPGNIYTIDKSCAALGDAKDAAKDAALLYEKCIKSLMNQNIIRTNKSSGIPQFDLQLLGMGHDGHMASLFPGFDQINEKESLVTYITDSPKPPSERITFTLPVINCASYNLMAVCGEAQADAVAKVFANDFSLPSARLTADTEVFWYLDKDAASQLPVPVPE